VGISQQPTGVIGTYEYCHVAVEKENRSMIVLECPGLI
jgi:hypothetical protein